MKLKIMKVIVSAFSALMIAQAFNLSTPSAAAIIAILSVMDTKKISLAATSQRLAAALLALFVGGIVFWIFGFDAMSFGIYLLCYIPMAVPTAREDVFRPCFSPTRSATSLYVHTV